MEFYREVRIDILKGRGLSLFIVYKKKRSIDFEIEERIRLKEKVLR